MRRKVLYSLTTFILVSFHTRSYSQEGTVSGLRFSGEVLAGYNRGLGLQVNITAFNFTQEFPFHLRFSTGYTFLNPGNALDARRIFINNNTNGVPEKKGRSIDLRLDILISKPFLGVNNSYLVLGPRFSTFRGNFVYIGGNEDFDVTSHQWGIGAGIENHFKMLQNLDLVLGYGLDFYIPSTLTGHDTSYSPDNDNVNPTRDNQNNDIYFMYRDADRAIKQPIFMPHVMLGVSFGL